jgi:hypothetical protein
MPIRWQSNYADAMTIANKERKPLFLDFFNPT